MRRLAPSIVLIGFLSLMPLPSQSQTPVETRFEQLRAARFAAVGAAADYVSAPQQTPESPPVVPETREDLFNPPWRARLSEQEWQFLSESFEAEGVPVELLAVGWVESRFNPRALSPRGARGAWQFMPETARRYGLQVDARRDERTDFTLSTRAAARHLADLYRQFGDWPLVLAAYNAGAGRVERALARSGRRDFFELRPWLPAETREFVPSVLRLSRGRAAAPRSSVVVFARPARQP
ncbi:MAG TPA: lytic transglycosylase domain-containing protein [Candidatus Xenobia bacterium]|nr:lytic transglycosylase domain-containing protein [Candidatus Xenobia bacterium]